MMHHYYS